LYRGNCRLGQQVPEKWREQNRPSLPAATERFVELLPEGDFVMNVAGFEEVLAAALQIELELGLVISVASLPGLAILKLAAWADRHLQNIKRLRTCTEFSQRLIAQGTRTASSIRNSNFLRAWTTICHLVVPCSWAVMLRELLILPQPNRSRLCRTLKHKSICLSPI
jgi:hypothetical protein